MERKRKRAVVDHLRGVRAKTDLPSVAPIYNHFLYEYPIQTSIIENAPLQQILSLRRLSKAKKNQIDTFLRTERYRKWNLPEENLIYEIGRLTFFGFNKDEDIPSQCEKMNIVLESTERVEGGNVYLSIPEGTISIEAGSYTNRDNIVKVWMPPSVETVYSNAFRGCVNLRKIRLSPNLVIIDDSGFSKCPNLERVRCFGELTHISTSAFAESGLRSVTFDDSSTPLTIDHSAFANCAHLTQIALPARTAFLGHHAFSKTAIERIAIPPNVEAILFSCFADCVSLETAVIEGLSQIPLCAFVGCVSLKHVKLPGSLRSIEELAFAHTSLEEISFPASLEYIGEAAFREASLRVVRFPPEAEARIEEDAFEGCPIETVYCSYSLYQNNPVFKKASSKKITFRFYEAMPDVEYQDGEVDP